MPILNEKCANVFKQFNLGETTLSPLKIHKLFTNKLWLEDTFYFLNLCEQRQYLSHPQEHEKFVYDKIGKISTYINYGTPIEENELMVNQLALECDRDLWHDPLFDESYFFSDRLANALIQAGFDKKWNLQPCKMV